jgi:predicted TIM-barrel fold metal-dependent hydrolase
VKSVHVQADISEDPVVETAWLDGIAERHGFPHAIVAYVDLRSDHVEAELDRHLVYARMRGVRMPDEPGLLTGKAFRRGVAAMAARGLSLQADTPFTRMPELAALADAFPQMSFALGHTGVPERRSAEYFGSWCTGLRDLARRDNTTVKISGLGMTEHTWTTQSIAPFVLEAIDAFGEERCMFGTNWPVDGLYSDLPTLADAYRAIVMGASELVQRDLLLHNAERFYGLA